MSKIHTRGLAVAAVLASSVAAALVGGVGAAHATTYGDPSPNSPVTVTVDNVVNVLGSRLTISLPAGAHDVSWAGQGGRLAYIGADNGVYTADFDGSNRIQIAKPVAGVTRSHTVWDVYNHYVLWGQSDGMIYRALANGNFVNWGAAPITIFANGDNRPDGSALSSPDVAADAAVTTVFETTSGSWHGIATESWSNGNQSYTTVLANGSSVDPTPTISPDGKTIVFVGLDGNNDKQLFSTTHGGSVWSTPVQVTFDAGVDHTAPIFEVDGKTVAYKSTDKGSSGTPMTGTYSVDITAAGGGANAVTQLSALVGGVAVRTDSQAVVTRFAGTDRFDTAVQASAFQWADAGVADPHRAPAKSVTLSRSDLFADALGGVGLAAHNDGPLLLTDTAKLTPETEAEITRILPQGSTVFLLGDTGAISQAVEDRLHSLGYTTVRLAGATRYETAIAIANRVDPNPQDILLATGNNFADALSAGAVAATFSGTVVVLSNDSSMPASTGAYINSRTLYNGPGTTGIDLAAIGGQADDAIQNYTGWTQNFMYSRLAGATRYETSHLVAQDFFGVENGIGVATGTNWPDALAGGAFMGGIGGPLLLVDPHSGLSDATDPDLGIYLGENAMIDANRGSNNYAFIFGGSDVVPDLVRDQLAADVATATGVATPGTPAKTQAQKAVLRSVEAGPVAPAPEAAEGPKGSIKSAKH